MLTKIVLIVSKNILLLDEIVRVLFDTILESVVLSDVERCSSAHFVL